MTILAAHHLALQRLIRILQTTQDDAEARRVAVAILRIPIPDNDAAVATEDAPHESPSLSPSHPEHPLPPPANPRTGVVVDGFASAAPNLMVPPAAQPRSRRAPKTHADHEYAKGRKVRKRTPTPPESWRRPGDVRHPHAPRDPA
jgi:hypothetical protein